jgi:hypothetical protein
MVSDRRGVKSCLAFTTSKKVFSASIPRVKSSGDSGSLHLSPYAWQIRLPG